MTHERLCTICAVRGRTPVHYETAQVCEPDRVWLAETLTAIVDLTGQLANHTTPRRSGAQRVSGSREAPLPFVADVHDLAAAARPGSIGVRYRGTWAHHPNGDPDQIGHLSVATELESWVTDWIATRGENEHLPLPLVPPLAGWLHDRLTWAADNHPAIDEFAATLLKLHGALRAYVPKEVGEDEEPPAGRPERRRAPCPGCENISLWWLPRDGKVHCDVEHCRRILTDDEYTEWARRVTHPANRTWLTELATDAPTEATCT